MTGRSFLITGLSDRAIESNIETAYLLASVDATRSGIDWYSAGHTFAIGMAARYELTVRQACGVIAALSPSTDWDKNLVLADVMARTGDCKHPYGDAIRKARRILNGEDPSEALGGNKVRSFFDNLLTPATSVEVTIDRHAHDIAAGRVTDDAERKVLERKGGYERIASCYRRAAARLGMAPCALQAITWVTWRELKAEDADLRLA